MQENSEG